MGKVLKYLLWCETLFTLGWKGDFEILRNCALKKNHPISKFLYKIYLKRRNSYIPIQCNLASGIKFPHLSGIHISCGATIGKNCVIYQNVTIGSNYIEGTKYQGAPRIGNNVLIGAGANIIGGGQIADNVRVGAGCVVVGDVPEGAIVVMNKPRIILKNQ